MPTTVEFLARHLARMGLGWHVLGRTDDCHGDGEMEIWNLEEADRVLRESGF
jgi:hypothetical protein